MKLLPKKRFPVAIYDNDCFNLHSSADNGLKQCGGGGMWRSKTCKFSYSRQFMRMC